MLALKIIGIIIIALFSLTLVSFKIKLSYNDDNLVVKVYYGLIGKTFFPQPEKSKPEKAKKDKKTPEKPKKTLESITEKLGSLRDLLESSKKALKIIKKHLIVDKIFAHITVGGEDAHQTAISYSHHITVLTGFLGILSEFCDVRIKDIKMEPNFISETSKYDLVLRARIRTIWLLWAAVHLLGAILKQANKSKKKGGSRNEPKTNQRTDQLSNVKP